MSTQTAGFHQGKNGWAGWVMAVVLAMALMLFPASRAWGFGNTPLIIFVLEGETVQVQLNGLGASGALNVTGANIGTAGVASTNVGGGQSVKGSNQVLVNITGLQVGSTNIEYTGTFKGTNVGTTVTVIVVPASTTFYQFPWSGIAGDPVSTATGEFFAAEATDFDLGGPMPLRFNRFSASSLKANGRLNGRLGDNRLHNFASRMEVTAFNRRDVLLPTGRIVTFQKTGTKWNLVRPLDVPYVLTEQAGGVFVFADPGVKQIWTYDATGKLTKIEDGKGNTHTLNYTGADLTSVVDGLGRTLTLAYSGGRISTVTDHTARQVLFGYTGNVLVTATDTGGKMTTYSNDNGLPTGATRPVGNTPMSQIYTDGKVTSQTERGTDVSSIAYGAGTTVFTDPAGNTLTDNYDGQGRLTSHVDEEGHSITMTSDAAGRRTGITDRLGNTTGIVYHAAGGRPAKVTNAEGRATTMTYKARTLNGLAFQDLAKTAFPDGSSMAFGYDAKGNVTQITDQAGKIWKYTYNTRGQVLTAANPAGGVSIFTYDAAGNLASSKDPDTGVTTYAYDTLSRLTGITRPDFSTMQVAYDVMGRITSVTDERGKVYSYTYDVNNRLQTMTDPDLNTAQLGYDLMDRVVQMTDRLGKVSSVTYNNLRLPATVTDRNGNATSYEYDDRRQPVKVTDAGGQEWTRTFDREGLLTGAATPINAAGRTKRNALGLPVEIANPLGHTTRLVRDAMQRVTQKIDPVGRQTLFTYEKRGLLTGVTEQGTGTAKYDYDALGGLAKITDPNGGAWTFGYTKGGRLAMAADPLNRKWGHTYDTRGRLLQTTFPDATNVARTYDAAGNLTRELYSAGPDLNFTYDNLNRPATAEGLIFDHDAEGRLTACDQNGHDFTATYDDGGRLLTVGYMDNAVVVTYEYDTRNRLTRVTDSVTTAQMDFTYDDAGRVTTMVRSNGANANYTYDDAGRLTRIQDGGSIDLQFGLNAAGEVGSVDYQVAAGSATPSAPAGPAQVFKFDKAGQVSTAGYAYDARGRLTAAPGATYGWDGASRLVNANGVALTYNGLDDVVLRTAGAAVTRFYHHYALGMTPIVYEDPEAGGGAERAYVWTPGGRLLYSIDMATSQAVFYHCDQVGSTLALTNEAGNVTDSYAYGPWGEAMVHTVGSSTQPFTYVGAYGVRQEGGLFQMRARYYDPVTARFLSRDPMAARLENPKSANPYLYADGDPASQVDPMGTDPIHFGVFFAGIMTNMEEQEQLDRWSQQYQQRCLESSALIDTAPAKPKRKGKGSRRGRPRTPRLSASPVVMPPGFGSTNTGDFFPGVCTDGNSGLGCGTGLPQDPGCSFVPGDLPLVPGCGDGLGGGFWTDGCGEGDLVQGCSGGDTLQGGEGGDNVSPGDLAGDSPATPPLTPAQSESATTQQSTSNMSPEIRKMLLSMYEGIYLGLLAAEQSLVQGGANGGIQGLGQNMKAIQAVNKNVRAIGGVIEALGGVLPTLPPP